MILHLRIAKQQIDRTVVFLPDHLSWMDDGSEHTKFVTALPYDFCSFALLRIIAAQSIPHICYIDFFLGAENGTPLMIGHIEEVLVLTYWQTSAINQLHCSQRRCTFL
ncbi:hypothetical protein ABZP36_012997 [Zizania latifolia]